MLKKNFVNWLRESIHKINKTFYSETDEDEIYKYVSKQIDHDNCFCIKFCAWDGFHLGATLILKANMEL